MLHRLLKATALGWACTSVVLALGSLFVVMALECYWQREGEQADRAAKNLFAYSVLYLFLLFAVILVEQGFGIGGGALPPVWAL